MSTFIIVNPASRLGETGTRLAELTGLLDRHIGAYTLLTTTCEGDAERLAREALAQGATRLIVAGGDGTVSEVLTAMLAGRGTSAVTLGVLPLGTGRDFARLLGLGEHLGRAVARFAAGRTTPVDAGRIEARGPDGTPRTRCFLNIASFGVSGESALWLKARAADGKRGRLSYLMSCVAGITRYRAPRVTLHLDGAPLHDGPLLLAAAANGQYFAGGIQVAPQALINDGQLDVVVVPKLPLATTLRRMPLLMLGEHVDGRTVHVRRGRLLEATSEAAVWIEADGEPIGTLPARFELLPSAVSLGGLP